MEEWRKAQLDPNSQGYVETPLEFAERKHVEDWEQNQGVYDWLEHICLVTGVESIEALGELAEIPIPGLDEDGEETDARADAVIRLDCRITEDVEAIIRAMGHVRAKRILHATSMRRIGTLRIGELARQPYDIGIAEIREVGVADPDYFTVLITWGENLTREDIEKSKFADHYVKHPDSDYYERVISGEYA